MAFIQVNGANVYYELHGQGQPVILIMGYGSDHTGSIAVLNELSKHFQVLIFDNRGVGQTTDEDLPFTIETMADDVIALIEALGLEKPHLIGQSMGGMIVQCIARKAKEKIGKIVIVNSVAKNNAAMLMAFSNILEMRKLGLPSENIFNAFLPWIRSGSFIENPANITAMKKAIANNPYPQSLADQERQLNAIRNFDSTTWVHTITNSTLVVSSEEDVTTLPVEAKRLAAAISGARYISIVGGHGAITEQPQVIMKVLKDFLLS